MAILDVDAGSQTSRHVIARFFEQLVASYIERRRRQREIAELMSLGPGAWRDLGIDRTEILSIVHSAGRDTTRIKR
jgi:uncharacterized protein YjiS (DUF1127 family)